MRAADHMFLQFFRMSADRPGPQAALDRQIFIFRAAELVSGPELSRTRKGIFAADQILFDPGHFDNDLNMANSRT